MKIYKVKTNDRVGYDEYDSVVVIANDENEAKEIAKEACYNFRDDLEVTEVGEANPDKEAGVVLSSFNAG